MKQKSQWWIQRSRCNLNLEFFWKKMKSPSSKKNGRFHLPSVWQASKNGSALYPFSQNVKPILTTQKKVKNKCQNCKKWGANPQSVTLQAVAGQQPVVACRPCTGALNYFLPKFYSFLLPTYFCTCIQLLLVGSSTCPPCPHFS
jgi:hypothetical protein